jgi:acyl-homoserine lactone acylase PvdQ
MGGVSGPRSVAGANGYGKVQIKFKKKVSKKGRGLIGLFLFSLGFFCLVFRAGWARDSLRRDYIAPALRFTLQKLDYMRYAILSYVFDGQSHVLLNLKTSSNINSIPGLENAVSIKKEIKSGFLSISAKTLKDAVYTQGYVHAGEQLSTMETSRRMAAGTQAEIYGRSYLSSDRLYRTLGIRKHAVNDWARIQSNNDLKEQVDLLEAYSDGVNHAISLQTYENKWWKPLELLIVNVAKTDNGLLNELQPWSPIDTLAILRLNALHSSQGWEKEHIRTSLNEILGSDFTQEFETFVASTYDKDKVSTGGTLWATMTSDSTPIISLDSHAPAEPRGSYILQMRWGNGNGGHGNDSSIEGVSQPGIPLIWAGSNGYGATWATVGSIEDTEDLYVEQLKKVSTSSLSSASIDAVDDADVEVFYKNKWQETSQREEMLTANPIGRDKIGSTEWFTVVETSHGPIISNLTSFSLNSEILAKYSQDSTGSGVDAETNASRSFGLALCSQALRQPIDLSYLLLVARAENKEDFQKAAQALQAEALHIVYAFEAPVAEIGHFLTGTPVIRQNGHNGLLPVSGGGSFDWKISNTGSHENRIENNNNIYFMDSKIPDMNEPANTNTANSDSNTNTNTNTNANTNHLLHKNYLTMSESDIKSEFAISMKNSILSLSFMNKNEIEENKMNIYDEDEKRYLLQAHAILSHFDGRYDINSIGASIMEATLDAVGTSLLRNTNNLIGLLRGAPLTGLKRDIPQIALLPTREWILKIVQSAVNSSDSDSNRGDQSIIQPIILSKILDIPMNESKSIGIEKEAKTRINSLVRDAVIEAMIWIEASYGNNRNYKNTAWQWGNVHRCTGPHTATHHSIIHALFSLNEVPCSGNIDTHHNYGSSYGFSKSASNVISLLQLKDSFFVKGYRSSLRVIFGVTGADITQGTYSSTNTQSFFHNGEGSSELWYSFSSSTSKTIFERYNLSPPLDKGTDKTREDL